MVTGVPQLVALGTATAVSCALTPLARWYAVRKGALAMPNERTKHKVPIPTSAGGVAIIIGFLVAIVASGAGRHFEPPKLAAILGGALFMAIVGLVDDRIDIPAKAKLGLQLLSTLPLLATGVTIDYVSNPLQGGMVWFPTLARWVVTVIWVVTVTNAINLIDGLDGLAAGVSTIACLALAMIALRANQPAAALLCAALAGGALGYLPWNWHPATVLMGDTGAYFLGYIIAASTIVGAFKMAAAIAIFVPVLVLVVPLFDTVFAPVRRYLRGQPAFKADRDHLHHRLLALGLSEPRVVLFIYTVSAVFGAVAIFMSRRG